MGSEMFTSKHLNFPKSEILKCLIMDTNNSSLDLMLQDNQLLMLQNERLKLKNELKQKIGSLEKELQKEQSQLHASEQSASTQTKN
ncbi:hypothetical protein HanPI659440_Chr06g0220491 [Helianthus annuus]|nr:hypothetical protein HanPI659440_Chr06g0220491 [Helianthus annuus]